MTKKELAEKAIKKIEDFDNIKAITVTVKLKNGDGVKAYEPIRNSKKYTKKETVLKKVEKALRNFKDEKCRTPNITAKNIKSIRVRAEYN